jgi:CO/xanthine dehydrogenase Mo-binding subunit
VVTREHRGHLNPFLDLASYGTEGEGAAPLIALEKVRYEGEPVAAVGVRIQELPITPEKVLRGLGKLA